MAPIQRFALLALALVLASCRANQPTDPPDDLFALSTLSRADVSVGGITVDYGGTAQYTSTFDIGERVTCPDSSCSSGDTLTFKNHQNQTGYSSHVMVYGTIDRAARRFTTLRFSGGFTASSGHGSSDYNSSSSATELSLHDVPYTLEGNIVTVLLKGSEISSHLTALNASSSSVSVGSPSSSTSIVNIHPFDDGATIRFTFQ
jgi:hypothetical protein